MIELFQPRHLVILFAFLVLVATVITILVRNSGRASGDDRSLSMRFRESFLSVVPRPARAAATIIVVLAVLIGVTVGIIANVRTASATHLPFPFAVLGVAGGLFIGSLFAIWVLGLGYVWGDARRRNMPYIPWTLVAAVVPNLLGFLLYFVLRKPIASPCPRCGQAIAAEQRFCPWCGYQAPSPAIAAVPPQTV